MLNDVFQILPLVTAEKNRSSFSSLVKLPQLLYLTVFPFVLSPSPPLFTNSSWAGNEKPKKENPCRIMIVGRLMFFGVDSTVSSWHTCSSGASSMFHPGWWLVPALRPGGYRRILSLSMSGHLFSVWDSFWLCCV